MTRIATVGDQVIVSLTNFIFMLAIGRAYSAEEFASYGIGLSIGLMLQGLQRHAITIPLMLKPDISVGHRHRAIIGQQWLVLAAALFIGGIVLSGVLLSGTSRFSQLIVGASLVCLIVYLQLEFSRAYFVKTRKPVLLLGSAGWYAAVSIMLAYAALTQRIGYDVLMAVLAAAMLIHALVMMALTAWPAFKPGWRLFRLDLRRYGGWSAVATLTYTGYNHVPLLILGALAAPIHAAAFVATRSLLQPLQILLRGLDIADKSTFTQAARKPRSRDALIFTLTLAGLYALIGVVFGVTCAVFADRLIALAYGDKFLGYSAALLAWVPAYIFLSVSMPMESLVYARNDFRGYFTIRGIASVFAIVASVPLIALYQDVGAVTACAAGWLLAVIGTLVFLIRGTRT